MYKSRMKKFVFEDFVLEEQGKIKGLPKSTMRIDDFSQIKLDEVELKRQFRYFEEYYNDCFRPNQGTEEILDLIQQYSPQGKWLDVGCGSTTLFWSLLTKGVCEIICADISAEALKVLDNFVKADYLPRCYAEVMEMYGISSETLAQNRKKIKYMYRFNALNRWPKALCNNQFDYITQFGVFGLAKTPKAYKECFSHMKQALSTNGICIGANWILSSAYANERGHDNSFLTTNLVREACVENNYVILNIGEKRVENDMNYNKIIYWAIKNQG